MIKASCSWHHGAVVCLLAALWVQLYIIEGSGWPHNAPQHHWLTPVSCHFQDYKALLVASLSHVSSAITCLQIFITSATLDTAVWVLLTFCNQCDYLSLRRISTVCRRLSHGSELQPGIKTLSIASPRPCRYVTCWSWWTVQLTRDQSNLTKSSSRGAHSRLGSPQGVESCTIEFLG